MSRRLALAVALLSAAPLLAAPVPKPVADRAELDRLWKQLGHGSGLEITEAVCRLAATPDDTSKLIAAKLQPLTLTKARAEQLIGLLGADDEAKWKGAFDELMTFDPRLALPIEDCWALATTDDRRRRLAWVLNDGVIEGTEESMFTLKPPKGKDEHWELSWRPKECVKPAGRNFGFIGVAKDVAELRTYHAGREKWEAECRALLVLDRTDTPAARKMIAAVATGHPDAAPTLDAKWLAGRRKAGRPAVDDVRNARVESKPGGGPLPLPPAEPPAAERREADWHSLEHMISTQDRIEAIHRLLSRPAETVAFFKTKLRPLKLEKKRADELLARLFGEKEAEWKGAVAEFATLDVRLAYTPREVWEKATTADERAKAAMVLHWDGARVIEDALYHDIRTREATVADGGRPGDLYFDHPLKPDLPKELFEKLSRQGLELHAPGDFVTLNERLWHRHESAVHILDAIGTDDAIAVIKNMATGHADAGPTKAAKTVLARRGMK